MFAFLKVEDIVKTTILIFLSAFVVVLYPVLLTLLIIITIFRYVIQQVIKRDPKVGRILSGMDANLAAHNTYSPKTILLPVYFVTSKVDVNQIATVFNDKIIKPTGTDGHCLYPELTQKIIRKWGYNWWYSVDNFRVEDHIRYLNEKYPDKIFSREEITEVIRNELLNLPFNPELSPWEIMVVNNYVDGRDPTIKAAIMFRFHHCLCDGYSIVKIMKTVATYPWKDLGGKMTTSNKSKMCIQNVMQNVLKFFLILLTLPYHCLKMMYFTDDKNDWARRAVYEHTDTVRVQEVEPMSLSAIKNVKNIHKVSFSSVIIGLVSEAILKSLARDNITNVDRLHIAMPFPLPDHPPDRLTNYWSAVKLPINVCKNDPLKTLQNIEKEFRNLRYSVAPLVGFYVSKVVGVLPVPMIPKPDDVIRCTGVLSNFPGPLHEIDLFGYKVREIGAAANTPKGHAFVIGCLSYNGKLKITVSGQICNFKEQEDMDFFASSYHEALQALREDTEQTGTIE